MSEPVLSTSGSTGSLSVPRSAAPGSAMPNPTDPDPTGPTAEQLIQQPVAATVPTPAGEPLPPPEQDPRWFQRAVFYEVLIRGFFDGNDDGTGDLPGLIAKLDYLQWLGVDCLWLLPFYPSPLPRRWLRHQRLLHGAPRLRHGGGPADAVAGGPRSWHPGHRRSGHQPHQRPASVVHRVPSEPRQSQGRLVRLERRRPTVARGPYRLRRRRAVQLGLRPGA